MFYKFFPYKELDYKMVIVYGFHFSFAFIYTLGFVRDFFLEHYFNFIVNFTTVIITLTSYYFLHYKNRAEESKFAIMFVIVVPLFTLIYFNNFANLVVIYVVLIPLVSYFMFSFKTGTIVNFLIYFILAILLYMISLKDPNEPTLHNLLALINITFAAILIMLFGLIYHLSIASHIRKLEKIISQKDILLKEVHHRVKNNLNVTASMLGLQALKEDEHTKEQLLKSKSRIEAIATVHEMLYKENDLESIHFNAYLKKFEAGVFSMYGNAGNVKFKCADQNNISLPLDKMVQIGLIINELCTNSIKHSSKSMEIEIEVFLSKVKDLYMLTYIEKSQKVYNLEMFKNSKGLGMKLINLSVAQLDATIDLTLDDSLKYIVEFR